MALPRAKLGVSLFRHPCRKPLSPGKGLYYWGYRPKSKQGCLQSATQSHCTMQWHKWLTTCTGATPLRPHFYIIKRFIDSLSRRKTACLNNHRTSQFKMPKTDIFAKSLSILSQAVSSELSLPVSPPLKSPCNASNIANFIS